MPATVGQQMSSEEHLAQPGWWPRKGTAARSEYIGSAACAECHGTLVAGQQQHAMAHTSQLVGEKSGPKQSISFEIGPAHYSIKRQNRTLSYNVIYKGQSFSAPLAWTFGSGHHGQTFLYRRGGEWWETHITVFNGFGVGVTPGESNALPGSLNEALGRKITDQELPQCFGCHATASVTSGKFDPARAIPGVSCEGCHGPGAAHVAMAHAGIGTNPGIIFNPVHLDPATSLDFCGSCHRTWWDALQKGDVGITVVRFPVYRLEQSRCWGNGDPRITCMACHDPHKPLVTAAAEYDQKCLSCHVKSASLTPSGDHLGKGCAVSTNNCVSCHMPKYELPQMHSSFTDHRIRVVANPGTVPTDWN